MGTCFKCGKALEGSSRFCSNCGALQNGETNPASGEDFRVKFEYFRGSWESWEELFQKAADFAARVGPERLISISHSEDGNDGVVTVWYWA